MRRTDDLLCREAEFFFQVVDHAHLAKAVAHPDPPQGNRAVLPKAFRGGAAEPADNRGVFRRNHRPRFHRAAKNRFFIERFDGMYIQHLGADPLPGQLLSRQKRLGHHDFSRKDRDITALAQSSRRIYTGPSCARICGNAARSWALSTGS